jgi:hypothetical protein
MLVLWILGGLVLLAALVLGAVYLMMKGWSA